MIDWISGPPELPPKRRVNLTIAHASTQISPAVYPVVSVSFRQLPEVSAFMLVTADKDSAMKALDGAVSKTLENVLQQVPEDSPRRLLLLLGILPFIRQGTTEQSAQHRTESG